jgi:hypothetical protein
MIIKMRLDTLITLQKKSRQAKIRKLRPLQAQGRTLRLLEKSTLSFPNRRKTNCSSMDA